ncbi:MAG: hypothetical protein WAK84_07665 [Candidatus Cybelea sp.]
MRCSSLAVPVAALLLTLAPARAGLPQTPGSNVLISECNPHPYNSGVEPGFLALPYRNAQQAKLAVEYHNQASTPVTAIVFGLVSGDRLVGIGEDSGRFSRDAAVSHELLLTQSVFPLGAQTHCVVLRVRYADGSAWFNPASPRF